MADFGVFGEHVRRFLWCLCIGLSSALVSCAAAPKPEGVGTVLPDAAAMVFPSSGHEGMDVWRDDFARRAVGRGYDSLLVTSLLSDIRPLSLWLKPPAGDEEGPTSPSGQAEFSRPIWDYLATPLSDTRMMTGRRKLDSLEPTLARIEEAFGVDREVLLAIWGMETGFGSFIGRDDAVNTLANMAVEGRRRTFAETELLAVISMIESGDVGREQLVSGWAGAMGHTQFMPTTFLTHAVDFDGDGRRDIWKSEADALASAANYLSRSGYRKGEPWGLEVLLPAGFDLTLADGFARPLTAWVGSGLVPARGRAFPDIQNSAAELWLPAGVHGPKFLLFSNFNVFRTYNRADSYALAIGLSADRLAGRSGLEASWPTGLDLLTPEEVRELQAGLNELGLEAGVVDGIAGRQTKAALQRFQALNGFVPDGYPTRQMLLGVRAVVGPS